MGQLFCRSGLAHVELRQANQSAACYQAHSHDEFSLGVIDQGSARYRYGRRREHSGAGSTVMINPGDIHACNPRAGVWSYRMLYIDAGWLGALQAEEQRTTVDYYPFAAPLLHDRTTYCEFDQLFTVLRCADDPLHSETALLAFLANRFASQPAQALGYAVRDRISQGQGRPGNRASVCVAISAIGRPGRGESLPPAAQF